MNILPSPIVRKILVVDNDQRLRDLLRRYLTDQGFCVLTAEDGQEMTKIWHREHIDLLVLDLILPGEDGLSICRRLRGNHDNTPLIMLTARAEYRLRLRADNAATRLTPLAMGMGCVSPARRDWFVSRETQRTALRDALERKVTGSALAELGLDVREPGQKQSLFEWMRFMALGQEHLSALCPEAATCSKAIIDELAEDARYAPYIARQEAEIREMRANDSISLQMVDFTAVPGLSNEMVERLNAARPATLGAAERVRMLASASEREVGGVAGGGRW